MILTSADYPDIDPADEGLTGNVGYGEVPGTRAHCIVGGAATALPSAISDSATTFSVLDGSRFPGSSFLIQIGSEQMLVGSRSGDTFSGVTRAYSGTTAAAHAAYDGVYEVLTEYVYLVSPLPVWSISAVYIDGYAQTDYTAYTGQTGDAHPDWPGQAVVSFTCWPHVAPQRNVDTSDLSTSVVMTPDCTSESYERPAWAVWSPGTGSLQSITWTASAGGLDDRRSYAGLRVIDLTTGSSLGTDTAIIEAGGSADLSVTYTGTVWPTCQAIANNTEASGATISTPTATALICPADNPQSRTRPTCTARIVIGAEVTVDASWSYESGAVMTRPDRVIMHYLMASGYASSEIDTASFAAAGTEYDTLGYRFDCVMPDGKVSGNAKSLAFQCRSTLRYDRGLWYLTFLPDAAPEAVATISQDDLAGAGAQFSFSRSRVTDLCNSAVASYRPAGSDWLGLATASDATSVATYGTYGGSFEFWAIRDTGTAQDVIDHIVLERKTPRLVVTFPVWWEYRDLKRGDTIEIEGDLYDGTVYCIESIATERGRSEITARQWW